MVTKRYEKWKNLIKVYSITVFLCLLFSPGERAEAGKQGDLVWKVFLRLGQAEGNEETTFFKVMDIAVDIKGFFYVLDVLRPAIQCFNAEGQYLGKIPLSKGRGPGEVIEPEELEVTCDGELVLLDRQLRRVYFYNRSEKTRQTISLPESYPLGVGNCMKLDSRKNVWIVHKDMKKNHAVHVYSPEGLLLRSLITVKPLELGASWPLPFTGYFDWYNEKIIFLKETPYEISVYDNNGSFLQDFKTDKSIMKPPKIIPSGAGFKLPPFDITEFVANISDRYVLSQLHLANRKQVRYDLFDIQTGKLVATRTDPIDSAFTFMAVKGDTLYAMTEAADYPEVIVMNFEIK